MKAFVTEGKEKIRRILANSRKFEENVGFQRLITPILRFISRTML